MGFSGVPSFAHVPGLLMNTQSPCSCVDASREKCSPRACISVLHWMRRRLFCALINKALPNLLYFGNRLWLVELRALSPARSEGDTLHSLIAPSRRHKAASIRKVPFICPGVLLLDKATPF